MKKRFLSLFLSLLLLSSLLPICALAAPSATATLSLSASKVTVGNTVNVTVTYQSTQDIGSYDFILNYDASLLQYVSGADSETGNGKLPFVNYNENSDLKKVVRTVKFKALATGQAKFSTQTKFIVDNASFSPMSVTEATKTLTVEPKQTASTNNKLKSLAVSGGSFAPAFSASETDYKMEVDFEVKKLTVSAVAEDKKAKVSVSDTTLKLGENKITITVTAESGAKRSYTLTVTRKQSAFANVTATVNGLNYVFAHDPDTLTPPEGFSASSATYGESQVLAFTDAEAFFTLVWLTHVSAPSSSVAPTQSQAASSTAPQGTPPATIEPSVAPTPRSGWYILEADGDLVPYLRLDAAQWYFVPLPLPQDTPLPQGYEPGTVTIGDHSLTVYQNSYTQANGLALVYGRSSDKTTGFFYWNPTSNTYSSFVPPETVTVTVTLPPASTAAQVGATAPNTQTPNATNQKLWIFSMAVTGLLILILIAYVVLMCQKSRLKKQVEQLNDAAAKRRRVARDPSAHFAPKALPEPEKTPEENQEIFKDE